MNFAEVCHYYKQMSKPTTIHVKQGVGMGVACGRKHDGGARSRCTYEEWVWHIVWVWYIVRTHVKLGASMGVAHDICKHLQM